MRFSLDLLLEDVRHRCWVERIHIYQLEVLHHVEGALLIGLEMLAGDMALISLLVAIDFQDTNLAGIALQFGGIDADDSRLLLY